MTIAEKKGRSFEIGLSFRLAPGNKSEPVIWRAICLFNNIPKRPSVPADGNVLV
jgi:hypothetical protein